MTIPDPWCSICMVRIAQGYRVFRASLCWKDCIIDRSIEGRLELEIWCKLPSHFCIIRASRSLTGMSECRVIDHIFHQPVCYSGPVQFDIYHSARVAIIGGHSKTRAIRYSIDDEWDHYLRPWSSGSFSIIATLLPESFRRINLFIGVSWNVNDARSGPGGWI